ncbi:hypothetical protein G5I_07067 [Acromyrmex echinatior]|uniref:Uncharacterized protein n=1 Tax=Acromyrmex echinatior TaxID=103372 RepID=F4WMT3_ACREC|nr:hypothetical protein G5I_07067 [Acromyrmex echinatior]
MADQSQVISVRRHSDCRLSTCYYPILNKDKIIHEDSRVTFPNSSQMTQYKVKSISFYPHRDAPISGHSHTPRRKGVGEVSKGWRTQLSPYNNREKGRKKRCLLSCPYGQYNASAQPVPNPSGYEPMTITSKSP